MSVKKPVVEHEVVVNKSLAERMFPLLVVVLFGCFFALGSMWTKIQYLESQPKTVPTTAQTQPTVPPKTLAEIKDLYGKNHIQFGDANKKNIFVEVADPSCPYCHAAAGLNPTLSKQMGNQFVTVADGGAYVAPVLEMRKLVEKGEAGYVYIYSPGHGNGELGTIAMYCAFDIGKFWPVHDLLMTNAGYEIMNTTVKNDRLQAKTLATFLKGVANFEQMSSCIASGKYDSRLVEESSIGGGLIQAADPRGGTPTFYINERGFSGAYSWNDMKSALK